MAQTKLKARQRSDYKYLLEYRTRWSDNDMYAHLNNTQYYHLFDSIVNTYLISHCGLRPGSSPSSLITPSSPIASVPSTSDSTLQRDATLLPYTPPSNLSLHQPPAPIPELIGLVVHSHCDYFAPLSFPCVADVALRVNKLGKSSVTYEIGVFERGSEDVKAVGEFVHVFVRRSDMRPWKEGMGDKIRSGLAQLVAEDGERAKL